MGVQSLSVTQLGATILHTLFTGIHVGTTVKYVRGTPRTSVVERTEAALVSIPDLLDAGDELEGGDAESTADLDIGALAVVGPVRVGGVVRNVTEPEFEGGMRLPRQVRIGGAYDWDAIGGPPVVIAIDADLRAYDPGGGERRMVAAGVERWLRPRRLAVRGGARFNTAGEKDQAITAGASVTVRAGVYVDGHAVYGGGAGEQGWGVAARVSF